MKTPSFWHRESFISTAVSPLSWLYQAGAQLREEFTQPEILSVPLICIGNVVAGGSGKTPIALSLGRHLRSLGIKVHFLSKGYGGTLAGPVLVNPGLQTISQIGDEAYLLHRIAPCWVAKSRTAAAKVAISAGAEMLIMDDGFQNPTLHKTFSFLVIDGGYGLGNGKTIPSGPLREPPAKAFSRAHAIIIVGEDVTGVREHIPSHLPVLWATLEPVQASAEALAGRDVIAFAGIGRPEKFFASLEQIGARIIERVSFADHHPFTSSDMESLSEKATRQKAILVTTEKDLTRIPEFYRPRIRTLSVEIMWHNPELLAQLLATL